MLLLWDTCSYKRGPISSLLHSGGFQSLEWRTARRVRKLMYKWTVWYGSKRLTRESICRCLIPKSRVKAIASQNLCGSSPQITSLQWNSTFALNVRLWVFPPHWWLKATYLSDWYCVAIIASPVGLSADTSVTLHRSVVLSDMGYSLWFLQLSSHYTVSIKSSDNDTHQRPASEIKYPPATHCIHSARTHSVRVRQRIRQGNCHWDELPDLDAAQKSTESTVFCILHGDISSPNWCLL